MVDLRPGAGSPWRRIGGAAGVVFGVGTAVGLVVLVGGAPTLTDSVSEMRDYFTDDATTYFVVNWLIALAFVFGLLIFASALRAVLSENDADAGVWSRVSYAGAVASVAVTGAGAAFWGALAIEGPDAFSDSTIQALVSMDAIVYGSILPWGLAVFLTGASVAILRNRLLWRWLGWLGLVIALVMVVGVLWVVDGDPDGPLAILAFSGTFATLLWSALTGVAMLRQPA